MEGREDLQEETETWDKRGAQKSMVVTLFVTHGIGDMDPREAATCDQAGTVVEMQGHQPTYKIFNPKLILSTRNGGIWDEAETEGIANQ